MKRVLSPGLLLGVLLGLPNAADLVLVKTAQAQSTTDARSTEGGERKVLKATDVSSQDAQDAALRAAARDARLAAIERLKQLINDSGAEGDQLAEMLLRLADLYFQEGRDLFFMEMEAYNTAVDKCFNTPGCSIDSVIVDHSQSGPWQEKSIKLYQRILTNHPQYPRADEATFYLAMALNDVGRPDEANQEFARLVRSYTESKYVPDAYVQIGEYWFERNQAYKALTAYQRAAAYRDSEKYAFANYKLAWCYYNVSEYEKAIETMKAVVLYSMQVQSTASGNAAKTNLQLQEEALKDLVRFFADAGQIEEAIDWFQKLGKADLIQETLKRLAATYFEQGKFELAIQTYRRLIAENPNGAKAPDYQNEIIQCYTKMGRKQETIDEIDRLLKSYGKNSSWARSNASNQDAVKQAEEYIEKNLRTVALNYHNEAKKIRTGPSAVKAYELAEQAYRVYLQEFPESKYSYDVRYGFSELLYTTKKYDEAYEQYMKVVAIDPKGQHSKFCADSAIFAADEMMKRETKPQMDATSKAAVDLTPWEQKKLAALDQFIQLFPEDQKTSGATYEAGYLLYNRNHFKEASDRFRIVISKEPQSSRAEKAANLILDAFVVTEDWSNLKEVSKAFYDQPSLGSTAFKAEVYEIYENASLKIIEVDFAKTQDKAKAAASYWAFYQEFPKSKNADLALNNTSVYYNDLGRKGDAMPVRLELINKFPQSKFYNDQVAALGFDYESIGDFQESATWYEKLYGLDSKHPGASDAIFSAAYFRNSLGQWEQSIKNYQQYITSYPDKSNINGITLEIAKIYEDHQKWTEASKVYLQFFSKPPAGATVEQVFFARLHYGLLMDEIGQGAKQTQHWNDTVKAWQTAKGAGQDMGTSGEYIAQILFILAEPQYKSFMAMKIDGPGGRSMGQKQLNDLLTKQLKDKLAALKAIDETYTKIVATGAGEWGLASLVRVGQAYENMSEALLNSYVPTYLTEEQREYYMIGMQDYAFPQVEKAVTAYNLALTKAYELSIYNDNTALAARRLGELRPNEYPGFYETLPETRFSSPSTSNASFETEP